MGFKETMKERLLTAFKKAGKMELPAISQETTDRKLLALRRERRLQSEELEKRRLQKAIHAHNVQRDKSFLLGGEKPLFNQKSGYFTTKKEKHKNIFMSRSR
jgi:hypothetical protein